MQNTPTPQQALELLTQATGTIQATRDAHQAIAQALQVLTSAIQPKEDKNGAGS